MPARAPRAPPGAGFLVIASVVTYWLFAHGLGEAYPVSPLGMFRDALDASSRVVVRRADGQLDEAFHYGDWLCDEPLDLKPGAHPACDDAGYSPQTTRVEDHIVAHRSAAPVGEAVELVLLTFRVRERGGPIETHECSLARCTARQER